MRMGLQWVQISLRGYGGEEPTGTAFFELLGLQPADGFPASPSDSPWKSANIVLAEVDMADCRDAEEPFGEFAARLDRGLQRAAVWLLARPPEAFQRWRAAGYKADVFVGGWLNNEQMDLEFPADFLAGLRPGGFADNHLHQRLRRPPTS